MNADLRPLARSLSFSSQKETHAYIIDYDGPGLVSKSRNLYVKGGTLYGETKKGGFWTSDSMSLDLYMGNDKGKFNLDQHSFAWSASGFKMKGTTLWASLNNGSSWPTEASLDLSLVLNVDKNGKLVFISQLVYFFLFRAMGLEFFSTSGINANALFLRFFVCLWRQMAGRLNFTVYVSTNMASWMPVQSTSITTTN